MHKLRRGEQTRGNKEDGELTMWKRLKARVDPKAFKASILWSCETEIKSLENGFSKGSMIHEGFGINSNDIV